MKPCFHPRHVINFINRIILDMVKTKGDFMHKIVEDFLIRNVTHLFIQA